MRSAFFSLLSAALVAVVSADSTTVEMFNAGRETLNLNSVRASIIGANAEATTYAVNCQSGAPVTVCPLNSPITITEGPSTFTMSAVYSTKTLGVDAKATLVQDCDITSSTQRASCSVSVGIEVSTRGLSTSTGLSTVTSFASDDIYYQPMTVTAGAEKLNAPQATETSDVAARNTGISGAAAAALAGAALRTSHSPIIYTNKRLACRGKGKSALGGFPIIEAHSTYGGATDLGSYA
ncbi:hypothetical protein P170DRAFT_468284 [Aspergillus steynii IBT 23096]|uniref:GPI anchored cell wall protein n=1 Tax=Aspergillus steynii IBT 23096 TaxID=1392250 RepID=A0A2I2FVH9_9EURO|nr:uncharacterized protein P170DRAFT_468284 [Aspergillus steynii IBT 23096]PLB44648.1 hypothetical protein P170DRAFT_468284 [Aspergillus steynii IBT 23096]